MNIPSLRLLICIENVVKIVTDIRSVENAIQQLLASQHQSSWLWLHKYLASLSDSSCGGGSGWAGHVATTAVSRWVIKLTFYCCHEKCNKVTKHFALAPIKIGVVLCDCCCRCCGCLSSFLAHFHGCRQLLLAFMNDKCHF